MDGKQSVKRLFSFSHSIAMVLLFASLFSSMSILANEESLTKSNEKIVREFVAAWSRLDTNELVEYFAKEGTYFNIPTQPVSGHENLRKFIGGFIANWDKTDWEIISLLAKGNTIMVERMDRTVVGGKPVNLPCFGIFEMKDGKIVEWRDYFDMGTYVKALSQ